jgi:orotate phosphoribosyltransferase
MIKGLVGQPEVMRWLISQLAYKVVEEAKFDFIEGNVTGGMIPGWELRNQVSELLGREVPFGYLRESRKEGGYSELITGIQNNPEIQKGMSAWIVEELVNYAGTTCNAAQVFRNAEFPVTHGACILSYDHAEARQRLAEHEMTLVSVITLPQLLDAAEAAGIFPKKAIDSYRTFLADPVVWQLDRGLVIPASAAKVATERGYTMRKLDAAEAIRLGAPEEKVKKDIVYFAKEEAA